MALAGLPELARQGAWSAAERYSPGDLARIAQHARERGVRVLPEVDMPAHASALQKSHPEAFLSFRCKGRGRKPPSFVLNPQTEATYAGLGARPIFTAEVSSPLSRASFKIKFII